MYAKIIKEKALQTQGRAQELQGPAPAMPRTKAPQRPGPHATGSTERAGAKQCQGPKHTEHPSDQGRRPAAGVRQLATARRPQKAPPPAADRIRGRAALPGAAERRVDAQHRRGYAVRGGGFAKASHAASLLGRFPSRCAGRFPRRRAGGSLPAGLLAAEDDGEPVGVEDLPRRLPRVLPRPRCWCACKLCAAGAWLRFSGAVLLGIAV